MSSCFMLLGWFALKDQFLHRLEAHRAHEKWSQTSTHGGYYSESDMKKPMCDGGLNFSAPLVNIKLILHIG